MTLSLGVTICGIASLISPLNSSDLFSTWIESPIWTILLSSFKSKWAFATKSLPEQLINAPRVNREVKNDLVKKNELNNASVQSVTIPLSQKAISINLTKNEINKHETIISNKSFAFDKKGNLIISGILFLVAIFIFVKLFKLINKSKEKPIKYDIYVGKLLKNYDRLIVNVETAPNLNDFSIIKIKQFEELLDLHDNYQEPIRYIEVTKHLKSYFYIQRNNEIFMYVVKSVDLED